MIAFLDANALIYLLEGQPGQVRQVQDCLQELVASGARLTVAMSRLSWLECRVKPLRAGDAVLLARYDHFFSSPNLRWIELDRDVIELAAALRARHGLRTPDALQAACCLNAGVPHVFITGDRAFAKVPGLTCRLVSGAASPPA